MQQQRGLQQAELAKLVGARPSMISVIEHERRGPSLSTAARLADALDVTLDYLTGRTPEAGPPSTSRPSGPDPLTARIKTLEQFRDDVENLAKQARAKRGD